MKSIAISVLILFVSNLWCQEKSSAHEQAMVLSEYVFINSPLFKSCHSASIVELPDGELLCTFFAGTREAAPDVEIYITRKPINGEWTEPVSVADGVEPDGDRMATGNPVLFMNKKEKLFLFYKVIKDKQFQGRLETSMDGGSTWSSAQKLDAPLLGAIKNKPIRLNDGTILSPSSTEDEHGWRIHIERSTDEGESWEHIGPLNPKAKIGAIQPALLVHSDDRIQLLARTR